MTTALLAVLTSAMLLTSSWLIPRALFRSATDRLTATVSLALFQPSVLVLVLGHLGALRPGPLAAAGITLGTAGAVWAARRDAAGRAALPGEERWGASRGRRAALPALVLLTALVAAQYLWRAVLSARVGGHDFDGNAFRLVSVDTWVSTGSLSETELPIWSSVSPQHTELLTAFPSVFLAHTQLAWATQFGYVLLACCALAGLGVRAGLTTVRAALAALLFAAIPVVFLQAGTTYPDVASAAGLLVTWQFLLAADDVGTGRQRGDRAHVTWYLFLAGTGLAVLLGTRFSNVVPVVLALVVAAYVAWQARHLPGSSKRTHRLRSSWRWPAAAAAASGLPLLVGASWYLANIVRHGNPVHPLRAPLVGGSLDPAATLIAPNEPVEIAERPDLVSRLAASWTYDLLPHEYVYDQRLGGFGPQWLVLLAGMLLGTLALLAFRRRWTVLLVVPTTLVFFTSAAPWWSRYTLFLAALACLGTLLAVQWLARRAETAVTLALIALSGLGMWWATSPSPITLADGQRASLDRAWELVLSNAERRRWGIQPWSEYTMLRGLPPNAGVAVPDATTARFPHVWIGERLDRRLVVVSYLGDLDRWVADVRATGAGWVAVDAKAGGAQPALLSEIAAVPDRFELVEGSGDIRLYRLRDS
ncbi:hypothetical protein C8D87_104444 [Lentzea atacamensis]|uniref:Glycosyltransferase RgtA/B/C/D-like domain-containing protein n=1 Tax=Lentzea atacamensis TaxID=531938 RepID=A0ABX9E873_9PSEU|nr:hypothetical protein [Lentzea atacamensis]RAS65893.1 hypothetical protein C8D87_104444 [Lentzea atacamensis]